MTKTRRISSGVTPAACNPSNRAARQVVGPVDERPALIGREKVGGDEPLRITEAEVEEQAPLSQFADLRARHAPPSTIER